MKSSLPRTHARASDSRKWLRNAALWNFSESRLLFRCPVLCRVACQISRIPQCWVAPDAGANRQDYHSLERQSQRRHSASESEKAKRTVVPATARL